MVMDLMRTWKQVFSTQEEWYRSISLCFHFKLYVLGSNTSNLKGFEDYLEYNRRWNLEYKRICSSFPYSLILGLWPLCMIGWVWLKVWRLRLIFYLKKATLNSQNHLGFPLNRPCLSCKLFWLFFTLLALQAFLM